MSYWHAWGGIMAEGTDFAGCWATIVLGPSIVIPEAAGGTTPPPDVSRLGLHYLTTWDHEPSDEEKAALTPEEYLDA